MEAEVLNKKKVLAPKLRFKEFEGEWKKKSIENIAELTSSKRVYLSDYVNIGIPFYRGKEITELKKNIIPKDILYISEASYLDFKNKYGVPQINDILMTAVGTLGNILRIQNNDKFYFKDGNLIWFRKITESSEFLEIILEVKKIDIEKTSIGSTQRALTMVELRKLIFHFPSLPEQQKIAAFLSAVDEKIQLLNRKKELLTQYKKGVMQQLFSGKLRFKDKQGKDFPEWEEKRLGEICNITTGRLDANAMVEGGKYRFYTCAKDYFQIDDFAFDTDALLISGNGANVGYIHHYKGKFNAYQRTYVLDGFNDNINYLKHFLDQHLYKRIFKEKKEGNTPYIVMGTLSEMKISLPDLNEQKMIADFLSNIDNKLENLSTQIIHTQTFKKGLLQQMFV
jgi:type I restriction enzyme S subunit